VNKIEMQLQLRDYAAHDYVVIKDNHNLPQLGNPMAGAC